MKKKKTFNDMKLQQKQKNSLTMIRKDNEQKQGIQ